MENKTSKKSVNSKTKPVSKSSTAKNTKQVNSANKTKANQTKASKTRSNQTKTSKTRASQTKTNQTKVSQTKNNQVNTNKASLKPKTTSSANKINIKGDIPRNKSNRASSKKKKVSFKKLGILSIIIVVVLFIVLSLTVLFPIDLIVVTGDSSYSNEEIIENSGIKLGSNILTLDRRNAENVLETTLPMIEEATVSISLPTTINVAVKEATAKYIYKSSRGNIIVSDKFKVLSQEGKNNNDLIELNGFTIISSPIAGKVKYAEDSVSIMLQNVIEAIEKSQIGKIKAINLSSNLTFSLNYDDRVTIKLGVSDKSLEKLKTAKDILENYETDEEGTLDISSDPSNGVFSPSNSQGGTIILPN